MKTPTKRSLTALLMTGAALYAVPASGQGLDDKFWIEAQFYWPKVDTTAEVSSLTDNTIGTEIDFESDLNLDDGEALPAIAAGARLGRKWRITAEYFALGRTGETTLSRNIVFDDVTYPVNAMISSEFDSDVYRFSVGYSFIRRENVEVGGALGLHATDFAISLAGNGTVAGNPVVAVQARQKEVLAPLPTIGLYGTVEIAPRVELSGNVDFLSLKVGDYDGRLVNLEASLSYRIMRNIGIGVSYRFVDYRLDVEKDDYVGRLTYEFQGPAVFLVAGF